MKSLSITPTTHSPLVEFDLNGNLLIEGRAIPEDVDKLFNPLIDFITNLDTPKAVLNINLEYFNTATSKKLLDLIKHFDSNNKIQKSLINWHYEEDDEDSLEMAQVYEESVMKSEFKYIRYMQSVSLFGKHVSNIPT